MLKCRIMKSYLKSSILVIWYKIMNMNSQKLILKKMLTPSCKIFRCKLTQWSLCHVITQESLTMIVKFCSMRRLTSTLMFTWLELRLASSNLEEITCSIGCSWSLIEAEICLFSLRGGVELEKKELSKRRLLEMLSKL